MSLSKVSTSSAPPTPPTRRFTFYVDPTPNHASITDTENFLKQNEGWENKLQIKTTLKQQLRIDTHDPILAELFRKTKTIGPHPVEFRERHPHPTACMSVIYDVPKDFNLKHFCDLKGVGNASILYQPRFGPTMSVALEWVDTPQHQIDLGENGVFHTYAYIPDPQRCAHCQRFGHTQRWCRNPVKCGYCSQKHSTQICHEKKMRGEIVHLHCPNCDQGHYAWAPQCHVNQQVKERILTRAKSESPLPIKVPQHWLRSYPTLTPPHPEQRHNLHRQVTQTITLPTTNNAQQSSTTNNTPASSTPNMTPILDATFSSPLPEPKGEQVTLAANQLDQLFDTMVLGMCQALDLKQPSQQAATLAEFKSIKTHYTSVLSCDQL